MKIQLDGTALNALFPEGSEQRLELTKAVIANFTRDILINEKSAIASEVISKLNGIRNEILNEVVNRFTTINNVFPVHRAKLEKEYQTHLEIVLKHFKERLDSESHKQVDEITRISKIRLERRLADMQLKAIEDFGRKLVSDTVMPLLDDLNIVNKQRLKLANKTIYPDINTELSNDL